MNWQKNPWIFSVALLVATTSLPGCGVKGDPLPPERPPRMGRGRPTYRKAAEKIKIESQSENERDADDEQRH